MTASAPSTHPAPASTCNPLTAAPSSPAGPPPAAPAPSTPSSTAMATSSRSTTQATRASRGSMLSAWNVKAVDTQASADSLTGGEKEKGLLTPRARVIPLLGSMALDSLIIYIF